MADVQNLYAASNQLGEAVIWHVASKRLLWIDLYKPRLYIHDPVNGSFEVKDIALQGPLGAIAATSDPDVLIISHLRGLSALSISTGETKFFADPERGRDAIIYNDIKCDRFGRLWVGTSHVREQETRGALWCVLSNGESYLADTGFAISNGPAFSRDGATMYFNDSVGRQTLAYDLTPNDPHARNRRVLVRYGDDEGLPDGVTVDAEDCLWVAHWGGSRITRLSPKGERLRTIDVPAPHVTTVGFGGEDLSTLYVTSARDGLTESALQHWPQSGDVFSCVPGPRGVAEPIFSLGQFHGIDS